MAKMDTYDKIFKDYEKYSRRATNIGVGTQLGIAAGTIVANNRIAKSLKAKKIDRMTPRSISLIAYDSRSEAMKSLNRGFNAVVKNANRSGRDFDPTMLSRYIEGVNAVNKEQAIINIDTKNKSDIVNFEATSRADEVNTQIDLKNAEAEMKVDQQKAGINLSTVRTVGNMAANIPNMLSRNEANILQAKAGLKLLSDNEEAILEAKAKAKAAEDEAKLASHANYMASSRASTSFAKDIESADLSLGKNDYVLGADSDQEFEFEEEEFREDDHPGLYSESVKGLGIPPLYSKKRGMDIETPGLNKPRIDFGPPWFNPPKQSTGFSSPGIPNVSAVSGGFSLNTPSLNKTTIGPANGPFSSKEGRDSYLDSLFKFYGNR